MMHLNLGVYHLLPEWSAYRLSDQGPMRLLYYDVDEDEVINERMLSLIGSECEAEEFLSS